MNMNTTTYRQRVQVFRAPRRIEPRGPQPQNWQTNIQKIADIKDLKFLMAEGRNAEVLRIDSSPKFPPIPIEIKDAPGLLYFVYAGSTPDEEDLKEKGIIAIAFARYYQDLSIHNFKPSYQQEILKQVLESFGYQGFKDRYERKIKFRGRHSD